MGFPPRGELDDPDNLWVGVVAPNGLDEPCDPTPRECDQDRVEAELKLWEEWQTYAMARDRPMTTCRHIVEFLIELNVIERREDESGVSWTVVSPLPNVEEVLPLPPERREHESKIRWQESFAQASRTITDWIDQHRVPGADMAEIEISLQNLADQAGLDPEDARHGLAILLDEDIRCDRDPETVAIELPLRIAIDWKLFEEWRTVYGATPPDSDFDADPN